MNPRPPIYLPINAHQKRRPLPAESNRRSAESPDDIGAEQIHYELNADFETSLMDAEDVQALVAAWQMGAISRDTRLHNFRQGEILPPRRTNEHELELLRKEPAPVIASLPRGM